MLRNDVKFMLKNNWEPKLPKKETVKKQIEKSNGKIAGSVRLALGKIATKKY